MKANKFETLNVKEQFILREILKEGQIGGLKYNYDLLEKYFNSTNNDSNKEFTFFRTYDEMQRIIRKMVNKNILKGKTVRVNEKLSPTGKASNFKFFSIKDYWRSNNTTQLQDFSFRCGLNNYRKKSFTRTLNAA